MKHPKPHKRPVQHKPHLYAKQPAGPPPKHPQRRRQQPAPKGTQHTYHPSAAPTARSQARQAKKSQPKKPAKPRGLALAGAAECCAAEAVAASLRLTGHPVSDADVLALHYAAGGTCDTAVTIGDVLGAAHGGGLGGVWPVTFAPVDLDDPAAVILGVDLPGAHAVTAAGGWWSSWGGWWPPAVFPDAVVEEAWAVTW